MSNPAIVLMTDPSRCSLGDVHHLVQALVEIQQMGEHAMPQAFCDHPAAAKEFIDAYANAYPQLVLEDREIPTPGHLHSLITNGQIGPLGRLPELTPPDELQRPIEQNGANAFPIVVLTLGNSQLLFDALQQSPTMRESIRLIEVGEERPDALSVSIADAVAVRGLDGDPWAHDRSDTELPVLDDVAGATKTDVASVALQDDQMDLDVVETADISSSDPSAYQHEVEPEPVRVEPPATAAQPAPLAGAEPAAAPTLAGDGLAGATAVEPALETAPPVVATWSTDTEPITEPLEPVIEPEAQAPDDTANEGEDDTASEGDGQDPPPATGSAGEDDAPEDDAPENDDGLEDEDVPEKKPAKHGDAAEAPGRGARDQDDDVAYPPVGSLIAGADVLYPALDDDSAQGALHELAAVLLDDGFIDADLAAELLGAYRNDGPLVSARQEAIETVRSSDDNVITLDDFQAAYEQESEDALADAGGVRPLHDSDL
jgi:hypothetical protein